jgi:hypothetical protein
MENRLSNIFNFKRSNDKPLSPEAIEANRRAEADRVAMIEQNIVNMAVALNSMIAAGATVMVDIEAGKILLPGRPNPGNAIIFFHKPAMMQTIHATVQPKEPDSGNGKHGEPKKEGE